MKSHEEWMWHALTLADKAEKQGEIPVGAVVVLNDVVIGEGWNQSIQCHDPSAHAEMLAVRQAGEALQNYRLEGATLYCTLEPCPMCAGLLIHSRVERLIFGAWDYKTGAAGSIMNLLESEKLNHQLEVTGGVLAEQCGEKLSAFFRHRRAQKKQDKIAAAKKVS